MKSHEWHAAATLDQPVRISHSRAMYEFCNPPHHHSAFPLKSAAKGFNARGHIPLLLLIWATSWPPWKDAAAVICTVPLRLYAAAAAAQLLDDMPFQVQLSLLTRFWQWPLQDSCSTWIRKKQPSPLESGRQPREKATKNSLPPPSHTVPSRSCPRRPSHRSTIRDLLTSSDGLLTKPCLQDLPFRIHPSLAYNPLK